MLKDNFDAPSSEDMQKAFPKLQEFQKKNLELKIKLVDCLDAQAIMELPSFRTEPLNFYKNMERFLWDSALPT